MKLVNLRCEYQKNPIGIDVKIPRLSWQIESNKKNVLQKSYHIQCADDDSFSKQNMLWDTGFIDSKMSNNIIYDGKKLPAFTRVYWRVAVETNKGNTNFCDAAYFETGFLNTKWAGSFITSAKKFNTNGPCPVLKKKFILDEIPISARLYITAFGLYQAHINEQSVNQDILAPGWTSYNNHVMYQTYDVTDMLIKGENLITAVLGSGWYKGSFAMRYRMNFYGDTAALLSQLIVSFRDGRTKIIKTDESWKSGNGGILYSEIYDGESYDARIEDKHRSESYEQWENAVVYNKNKDIKIVGQNTPGVRVIDEISPVEIIITPKGDTVLDFGQNMVGWVKVSASGKSGDEIYLLHGEIMLQDEFYNVNMRTAKTEAKYILNGKGEETFEPHFTFFGFRYVKLEKYPGEVLLENFKGMVISSNLEYSGEFKCSNDKVNRLFQNIIWGQKGNFVDVPTDCPQRDERLGWTGDTQVFAATACYNSLSAPFYEKWLKDVVYDQFPNGAIPYVIPDILFDTRACSAWGDAGVIVPSVHYKFYGDKSVLKRQYDSMRKWVEYIRAQGESETLWDTGFHFNDWLAQDGYGQSKTHGATPVHLVSTAFYYNSVSLLKDAAAILDYAKDVKEYSMLADLIKKSFNEEFVTPNGRVSGETQTAYTLALHFGLLYDTSIFKAAYHLAELVRREKHHITTGFLGAPYIAHALSDNGYNEDAYRLLLNEEFPGWLYQVNMGATTIWERWDGLMPDNSINLGGMNSFNHYAYGAIGQWLYQTVLGIIPNNGFQEFIIAPKPCGLLKNAQGGLDTLYGRIDSSWELRDDIIELEFTIPCNTTADVCLPLAHREDIQYDGEMTVSKDGLLMKLGSGKYSFSYSNEDTKRMIERDGSSDDVKMDFPVWEETIDEDQK